MMFSAFRASPFPDGQTLRFGIAIAAGVTKLTGRIEGINRLYFLSVPSRFVLQLSAKLIERHIGQGSRQLVILHHTLGFQVFNANHIVVANQIRCSLLQVVLPLIGDMLFKSGFADALFLPAFASLLLSGKTA